MKRRPSAISLAPALLIAALAAGNAAEPLASSRISEYQCYQLGRAWDASNGKCDMNPMTKPACQRRGGHWVDGGCDMIDVARARCAGEGGELKVDYHGNYSCERAGSNPFRTKSIFGQDNRQDLYQAADPRVQRWADSTVALIPLVDLTQDSSNGGYTLRRQLYGQALNLCSDEHFWDQPMGADCSGFLAARDLIVTGASCIRDSDQCRQYKFVFGFSIAQQGKFPMSFQSSDAYDCKKIVASDLGYDHWAVIQLDRPVSGRRPLAVDRSGGGETGTSVVSVGPDLIPTKVSNGKITGSDVPDTFRADIDGGNSGIPVFNSNTGLVEGIMTWFPPSFQWDQARQCYAETRCPDGGTQGGLCAGVAVTKMSVIAGALPPLELPEQSEKKVDAPPSNLRDFAASAAAAEATAAALSRQ